MVFKLPKFFYYSWGLIRWGSWFAGRQPLGVGHGGQCAQPLEVGCVDSSGTPVALSSRSFDLLMPF